MWIAIIVAAVLVVGVVGAFMLKRAKSRREINHDMYTLF